MTPVNGSGLKRAVLINDLSCFGKCSLSVSIPVISSYGVETVPLPTAVLSTHTGGFDRYVIHDMTESMRAFAAHWKQLELEFDCIYTGFFCSVEQIGFAREFIQNFAGPGTLILVDPVLGDNGSLYGCFTDEFVVAMRRLCRSAHIITPNWTEATLLAGVSGPRTAGQLLEEIGVQNAVITGVRSGGRIGYAARLDNQLLEIDKPYVDMPLHGTGDVFTSSFCGELLSGKSKAEALESAADFCDECVRATAKRRPAHWYGLSFEDVLKQGKNV